MTSDQPVPLPRIGTGTDVHAFADPADGRELWVAGLHWPGENGLAGHSDADVVAHAAADAIFSATGLGDLGSQLRHERSGVGRGERRSPPRRGRRRVLVPRGSGSGTSRSSSSGTGPASVPAVRRPSGVLSEAAGAPVTVTATTTDGLGLTGRGEGVAALATALVVHEG